MKFTRVLLYACDRDLLTTRSVILEKFGYKVVGATEYGDATSLCVRQDPAIAVICHTVPRLECLDFIRFLQACCPQIECLVLQGSGRVFDLPLGAWKHSVSYGPEAFVETVMMLTRWPHGSQHQVLLPSTL